MSLCAKVIQGLCKMESMIYPLGNLKRLSGFPFPLDEIGMMVNHGVWHKDHVIERYFICIGYNKEKYNSSEVDRRPSFGIIAPGTVMNTREIIRHDELFFSYPASMTEKLNAVFDPLPPERRRFHFTPDSKFKRNLETIRELLNSRMTLGTADKLDVLAMEMIIGMTVDGGISDSADDPLNAVLKLEEIAEKLRRGAHLEQLIHQYGYSRRAFYYEWNRKFSMSPKQMQLEAKLQKAQCLLVASSLSISEIAQDCGFSSHRYFHECFMRQYLCTPGEYRRRYKSANSSHQ